MPRFFFSRPSSLPRFPCFRPATSFCLGLSLGCGAFCVSAPARADEFSVLPPGDPITVQLAVIATDFSPQSLTRYEAALQTARVFLDVQSRPGNAVSRAQWRALAALSVSLKSELRQLGVDSDAARALALRNLKATESRTTQTAGQNINKTTGESASLISLSRRAVKSPATRNSSFLAPDLVSGLAPSEGVSRPALDVRLTPRLRIATQFQTGARPGLGSPETATPFAPRTALTGPPGAATFSSQTALSFDLSRYLTLRAANSRLNWEGAGENPLLEAPIFAGARGASATGGGVDLNLGSALKFSTDVERLRSSTGTLASRIGGSASLSAWQDRFSLNMSLSRLLPEDKTTLPATAARVGASLDVSRRLSLNLSYQGLFTPTPSTSASRVAGGASLSF